MDRPSTRQLECLVAVADHGSFRKAATSLGISQPALSAQVQGVEQLLGVQVFERDRRSVLVTPAGEDIVGRSRIALESIDAVNDAARRRAEPLVGPLRLGVIPTIAPYWLPALLPAVRNRTPARSARRRPDRCRVPRDSRPGRRHDRADRAGDILARRTAWHADARQARQVDRSRS